MSGPSKEYFADAPPRRRRPQAMALALQALLAAGCGGGPAGGRTPDVDCAALPPPPVDTGNHWVPGPIRSFQITHFEGPADLLARLRPVDVVTLELDQVEAAGGLSLTDRIRAQGTRVICYTSTGYEAWRSDASAYPGAARGGPICQDDACNSTWPGENWGDITHPELVTFLGTRTERARAAGCDGIEYDNIDLAFNRTGLQIDVPENVSAAYQLSQLAHDRGLAAIAKNAGELACALAQSFDGVFIEECHQTAECDTYRPYAGKLVAMVEYEAACTPGGWAPCQRQADYFEGD